MKSIKLRITALPLMAILFMLCAGCARKIIVPEVLQLPEGSKVYTAYNIWYENPTDISCMNYQKGKLLTFGTEVEIIGADDTSISFKDKKTNKKFTIRYTETWMMMPMENFIKRLLTTKDRKALTEDMKQVIVEKISRGVVEEGMTRKEVLLAYGYPVAHRTPSLEEDTWIYWSDKLSSIRVVFKNEKVIAILRFD